MARLNIPLALSTGLNTRLDPPTVTDCDPAEGDIAGGTAITITGTKFKPGCEASVGGVACTSVVRVSATSVTAITGAHAAGVVNVTVSNPNGQSGTGVGLFEYTEA